MSDGPAAGPDATGLVGDAVDVDRVDCDDAGDDAGCDDEGRRGMKRVLVESAGQTGTTSLGRDAS
jgi:hypothetical protein